MKLSVKRKRQHNTTSKGINAFYTKKVDYPMELRPMYESGRYDLIADSMIVDGVINSGSSNFEAISDEVWRRLDEQHKHCIYDEWHPDYWLKRGIENWPREYHETADIYRAYSAKKDLFRKRYVPVRWRPINSHDIDLGSFAQYLMIDCAHKEEMPLYNFAYGRTNGMEVLYARVGWLRTFRLGLQLFNYYTHARNFEKVYGIDGYDDRIEFDFDY